MLIDQAKVIQEGNTFEGEKIVYDTQRQIVQPVVLAPRSLRHGHGST